MKLSDWTVRPVFPSLSQMLIDSSFKKQDTPQACIRQLLLAACYATLHPALSIHLSVRLSITLYFFGGFAVFGLTAPAQMIKCPQIRSLPIRAQLG